MHDGGAGGEVGAEAHTGCVGDAHPFGQDVVEHPRELVDAGDNNSVALERHAKRTEVIGVYGTGVGPDDDRQGAEESVEVDAVGLHEQVAEQVQTQVGVGYVLRCGIQIDLDGDAFGADTAAFIRAQVFFEVGGCVVRVGALGN